MGKIENEVVARIDELEQLLKFRQDRGEAFQQTPMPIKDNKVFNGFKLTPMQDVVVPTVVIDKRLEFLRATKSIKGDKDV